MPRKVKSIPPSAFRQPPRPPHHRCSDGGDSNQLDKQENTSMSKEVECSNLKANSTATDSLLEQVECSNSSTHSYNLRRRNKAPEYAECTNSNSSTHPYNLRRRHKKADSTTINSLPEEQAECSNSRTRPYRHKKAIPTTIDALPEHLLFDILLLVPADSLYDGARLVCRSWFRIIHSQDFINSQLQHSTNHGLLLSSPEQWLGHPIHVTAARGRVRITRLSYRCRTSLLTSSNGLAMELHLNNREEASSLHLINPATKQPFLIPRPSAPSYVDHSFCGIVYSEASMEHKITVQYSSSNGDPILHEPLGLAILTAGVDESWRNVEVGHLPFHIRLLFLRSPLTTEGFLHWAGDRSVLSMDAGTEILTCRQLPPAQFPPFARRYYLSTGKHLSMLLELEGKDFWWEIWEMKSETGEWRKAGSHKIDLSGAMRRRRDEGQVSSSPVPLGWVEYLEVLALTYRGRTVFYNLDTREVDKVKLPMTSRAFVHRNNLVWLS